MNTRIALWVIIGAMFIVALFLTFKAGASGAGEAVKATGNIAKSVASTGMVGGC